MSIIYEGTIVWGEPADRSDAMRKIEAAVNAENFGQAAHLGDVLDRYMPGGNVVRLHLNGTWELIEIGQKGHQA